MKNIMRHHRKWKSGVFCLAALACATQQVFAQGSDPIGQYLTSPAALEERQKQESYSALCEAIPAMKREELIAGISDIDRTLDSTSDEGNIYLKRQAAQFLEVIATRADGWELLQSQVPRLKAMIRSTDAPSGFLALRTFRALSVQEPRAVLGSLEDALSDPDINRSGVGGAGVASFLLWTGNAREESTEHVVRYMQRSDLTDAEMLNVIRAITQTGYVTTSLANELTHVLDRHDNLVKAAALVLLEKGGSSAREIARSRLEIMVRDPSEAVEVRRSASAVLNEKSMPTAHR